MRITVTGSLGNVSRALVTQLVKGGHNVNVISSDKNKVDVIKQLGVTPLIGSLLDTVFVEDSFKNVDAVFTMAPPNFMADDYYEFSKTVQENYINAIIKNGIKKSDKSILIHFYRSVFPEVNPIIS